MELVEAHDETEVIEDEEAREGGIEGEEKIADEGSCGRSGADNI